MLVGTREEDFGLFGLRGWEGLGDERTTAEISTGTAVAGSVVAIPAVATAIGIGTAFIPFVGPIVAGVVLAISALGIGKGCGQTCVISTKIVDQIEPYMKQNVSAAQSQAAANGGFLTSGERDALVGNFNYLWDAVVKQCGDPNLKSAGQRCVSDRSRGGQWDWFAYYLDPITSIPVKDPTSSPTINSALALVGGGSNWLLWGGVGLMGLALIAGIGGKGR